MSATRQSFVEHFGEEQAARIEEAAAMHESSENKGADPFRWVIAIAIGWQCAEIDGYRSHHGITAPWDDIKQWIKDHADLAHHDGDVDVLSLLAGAYNEYMPAKAAS